MDIKNSDKHDNNTTKIATKNKGISIIVVIGILALMFVANSSFNSNYVANTKENQPEIINTINLSKDSISRSPKKIKNSSSDTSDLDDSGWKEFVPITKSF